MVIAKITGAPTPNEQTEKINEIIDNIPTVNNATLTITQGGVSKGTFTANASSDVTIALDAGGSVDIDNKSITTNTSDELQTVGVIDNNNTTNAIKTWTGTKAQYDAIVTKDANTLYNITDDTDVTLTLLNLLYPVGSLYIASGNLSTCPLSVLGVGTWSLKTTTTLVTRVNSTAPVVGNGITLGFTNGTINFGSYKSSNSQYPRYCLSSRDYGKAIGVSAPDNTNTEGNDIVIGVTTDPDKSGIEANITSTTLAVTIWERTA